jgi:hypothetical protein
MRLGEHWETKLGELREMKLGGNWEMRYVFSFAPKTPKNFPKPKNPGRN